MRDLFKDTYYILPSGDKTGYLLLHAPTDFCLATGNLSQVCNAIVRFIKKYKTPESLSFAVRNTTSYATMPHSLSLERQQQKKELGNAFADMINKSVLLGLEEMEKEMNAPIDIGLGRKKIKKPIIHKCTGVQSSDSGNDNPVRKCIFKRNALTKK